MSTPKVQHWFRPVYGLKPDGDIIALRLTDDGKLEGINQIIEASGGVIEETATGGTTTSVQDTKKDWQPDMWKGSILDITVEGNRYFRKITGNTDDTLNFEGVLDDAVGEGDTYKVIAIASTVNVDNLQADDETLASIVTAIGALQADTETLASIVSAIGALQTDTETLGDIVQGISQVLNLINYYGNFKFEFQVTDNATTSGDIVITLTPDNIYEEGSPTDDVFTIGVLDTDGDRAIAEAIVAEIDAHDDYNASMFPEGPFFLVEHVDKVHIAVDFADGDTGVTLAHQEIQKTIMSELQEIRDNSFQEFEWSETLTSSIDSAADLIVTGISGMSHIITGFEVAIRGGEAASDMVISIEDDTDKIYTTVIGQGAPTGERVGMVFNKGISISPGNNVTLSVPAGGAGVIAELNLVGITK